MQHRGKPPPGDRLRSALRWLSARGRHDTAAIEEACQRYDLSPLEEQFLLSEARRLQRGKPPADDSGKPAP